MVTQSHTTHFNVESPEARAALDAERRLLERLGLTFRTHWVEMAEPPLRIRVVEIGEGEPVLMVPGGNGDAFGLIPMLAQMPGFRFLLVNRPGGGLSSAVDYKHVDMRRVAVDSLRAVMDSFQLDTVPVGANSMGGLWSFWLALHHPERVSRFVQLGCPALVLGTSAPPFMRVLSVPVLNRLLWSKISSKSEPSLDFLTTLGSYPEQIAEMCAELAECEFYFAQTQGASAAWLSLMQAALTPVGSSRRYRMDAEELRRIKQPTLFLWGDNDPFGGLDVARRLVEIMPHATLHEVHAGHLPYMDNPSVCAEKAREFLSAG